MDEAQKFTKWSEFYGTSEAAGTSLVWPDATLIRIFKGGYLPEMDKDYAGKRVLDVGFGDGNNLRLFASLGMELAGTEVSESICKTVKDRLEQTGVEADLLVGTNRRIPWADCSFDFLVSWSVLHYEGEESRIREALAEYARVLKPMGRFFIATAGPDHKIMKDSRLVGAHQYLIGRADDFRKGQVMFYFDQPRYLKCYLSVNFLDVRVGRVYNTLFDETADFFIATGVKA